MKKQWLLLWLVMGVVGGVYASVGRLSGMGLLYPETNSWETTWIVDDPVTIRENGASLYRLSNEVGLEPMRFITSTNWKDGFGYGVFHQPWFSLGILINGHREDDYFEVYAGHQLSRAPTYPGLTPLPYNEINYRDTLPWFTMVLGSQKIPFSPYLELSVIAAAYSTNYEHIPNPVDSTKVMVHYEEDAFLWKMYAGASITILPPLVIDAALGVWLPFAKTQMKSSLTEIQNFQNENTLTSEGNIGFEIKLYPWMKLSPQLTWKNKLSYRYLNQSSMHTVNIDLNGDKDFVDPGEEKVAIRTHCHLI